MGERENCDPKVLGRIIDCIIDKMRKNPNQWYSFSQIRKPDFRSYLVQSIGFLPNQRLNSTDWEEAWRCIYESHEVERSREVSDVKTAKLRLRVDSTNSQERGVLMSTDTWSVITKGEEVDQAARVLIDLLIESPSWLIPEIWKEVSNRIERTIPSRKRSPIIRRARTLVKDKGQIVTQGDSLILSLFTKVPPNATKSQETQSRTSPAVRFSSGVHAVVEFTGDPIEIEGPVEIEALLVGGGKINAVVKKLVILPVIVIVILVIAQVFGA